MSILRSIRNHPIRCGISVILVVVAMWGLLLPGFTSARYAFFDSGLGGGTAGPSDFAISNHRQFSDRYAGYCKERIASGVAATLDMHDIAGTEWPLFGSAFYLWSTVALQRAYEENPDRFPKGEPKVYASRAIEAATSLILDPAHGQWVRDHWGETYLTRENCFYRMLIVSALAAHLELTGGTDVYRARLETQVEALTSELLESKSGLIDDYPGQCYPGDVVAAVRAVHEANVLLGQDDAAFLSAMGAKLFRSDQVAPNGLLPYAADTITGRPYDPSRGCGSSYFIPFASELWPEFAEEWVETYVDDFWQQNWLAAGFREFPHEAGNATYFDVDAGPVLGGIGMSATTFGIAVARSGGDEVHARVLGTEAIVASWPLPNGVMFLPRLASDGDHAPYLGQCALLFQLSFPQVTDTRVPQDRIFLPACVYLGLLAYFLVGGLLLRWAWKIWPGMLWSERTRKW